MRDGVKEPIPLAPHDVIFVPRTEVTDANIWVRQHITDMVPLFRGVGVGATPGWVLIGVRPDGARRGCVDRSTRPWIGQGREGAKL